MLRVYSYESRGIFKKTQSRQDWVWTYERWRHLAESNRSPELCRLLYNRSTKAPEPWHYRDYTKKARRSSLRNNRTDATKRWKEFYITVELLQPVKISQDTLSRDWKESCDRVQYVFHRAHEWRSNRWDHRVLPHYWYGYSRDVENLVFSAFVLYRHSLQPSEELYVHESIHFHSYDEITSLERWDSSVFDVS